MSDLKRSRKGLRTREHTHISGGCQRKKNDNKANRWRQKTYKLPDLYPNFSPTVHSIKISKIKAISPTLLFGYNGSETLLIRWIRSFSNSKLMPYLLLLHSFFFFSFKIQYKHSKRFHKFYDNFVNEQQCSIMFRAKMHISSCFVSIDLSNPDFLIPFTKALRIHSCALSGFCAPMHLSSCFVTLFL